MSTFIGSNTLNATSGGNRTMTFPANVNVGDIIFVYATSDPTGTVTVTDGANTYATTSQLTGTLSDGTGMYWTYSIATATRTTANSMTVNFAGGGSYCTAGMYIFRPATGQVFGVPTLIAQTAIATSTTATASGGAFNINGIAIGGLAFTGTGTTVTGDTDTTGGTWAAGVRVNAGTGGGQFRQYKIITAAGSQSWDLTLTSASRHAALFYIPALTVATASGSSTSDASAAITSSIRPRIIGDNSTSANSPDAGARTSFNPVIEGSSTSTNSVENIGMDIRSFNLSGSSDSTNSSFNAINDLRLQGTGSSITDATFTPVFSFRPIIEGSSVSTNSPDYSIKVDWYPAMLGQDSTSAASFGGIRAVIGPEMFGGSVSDASFAPFFRYFPIAEGSSDSSNSPDMTPRLTFAPVAQGLSLSVFSPDVTPSVDYRPIAEGSSTSDGTTIVPPMGTMTTNQFIGWGIPA